MKTLILIGFLVTGVAYGFDDSFERGYSEGWKAQRGSLTIVPITPIPPITPIGSNPYREGLKRGFNDGSSRRNQLQIPDYGNYNYQPQILR